MCSGFRLQSLYGCMLPWIARAKYPGTVTPTRFVSSKARGLRHEVNRRLPKWDCGRLEAVGPNSVEDGIRLSPISTFLVNLSVVRLRGYRVFYDGRLAKDFLINGRESSAAWPGS